MNGDTTSPKREEVPGIDPSQRLVLSERDFTRFVEMIENPPPPTRKLREAMAEFRRLQAAHPEADL